MTDETPDAHLSIEELSALRDGIAPAPERRAHLAACAVCRREAEAWRSIGESVAALAAEPWPVGLESRVIQRLRDATGAGVPGWLGFWTRPIGVAAALVLLVASVIAADRLIDDRSETPADWFWAAGLDAGQTTSFADGALDTGVEDLAPGGPGVGAAPGESLGGTP